MIEINGINYLEQVKDNVSNLAHLMKGNDSLAISFFANFVLKQNVVDDNSILIPCPQHSGSAIYTLNAANLIASRSGATVLDIIKRTPGDTIYNLKQSKSFDTVKPEYFLSSPFSKKPGQKVFLVDNVIGSGFSYSQISKLIPCQPLVLATNLNKDEMQKLIKINQFEKQSHHNKIHL